MTRIVPKSIVQTFPVSKLEKESKKTLPAVDTFEPAPTQKVSFEKRLESVSDPVGALNLIQTVLARGDGKTERLQVHHVFDKARAGGFLDATLTALKSAMPTSKVALELIAQANPSVKPVEITHRGTIGDTHPENTLEGIQDAVKRGSTGLEIDLSFTKDGKIVLWHDADPKTLVAAIRRNGFEKGNFEPTVSDDAKKRVDQLTLAEVQKGFGYRTKDGQTSPYKVPTFDDVAAFLKDHPEVKTVALDVKVNGSKTVNQSFARELDRVLTENGLADRVFLMQPDLKAARQLKEVLGDRYPLSHDIDVPGLHHEPISGLKTADEMGNSVTSMGLQPFGSNAYPSFVESVRHDRAQIEADRLAGKVPKKLYVWTLDDELQLREAIANGVDGIVTNRPFFLQQLIRRYWP